MTNTDSKTRRQILATTINAIHHFIVRTNIYTESLDKLDINLWHLKNLHAALLIQFEDLKEAEAREAVLEAEAAKAEAAANTTEPDTENIF